MKHILEGHIPMDRRRALLAGEDLPDRASGTGLFADISGFTPLTQALAREMGERRGPEELVGILNRVYSALLAPVHDFGGSAVAFSGDAVTCWFDGDHGSRAVACALAMQQAMHQIANVVTPAGSHFQLAVKIAVVAGQVRRFLLGDPNVLLIDALAGSNLDRLAAGEQLCNAGEIVVGSEIVLPLQDVLSVKEWRGDPQENLSFGLIDGLSVDVARCPWASTQPLPDHLVEPWVLPAVRAHMAEGDSAFWATLRPITPLFLKFSGIDYDNDDEAGQKLDAYVRWVQSVVADHEGFLTQVTMGDKGSYLFIAFGAPVAHDDDPSRAVSAALRLRASPPDLSFIDSVQIGITTGQVLAGAYGSVTRWTYGTQGPEVNMAARLMSHAARGQILVTRQVVKRAGNRHEFRGLGTITVKGRTRPLWVAEALGERSGSWLFTGQLEHTELVGRQDLMAEMLGELEAAHRGTGRILRLEGHAGIGKSQLVAEVIRQAVNNGWSAATATCQSTTQSAPFQPWRQILGGLLHLADGSEEAAGDEAAQALAQRIADLNPTWLPRLPLLADLLGVSMAQNPTIDRMDPSQRQQALFTLVVSIIQAQAEVQPLLLVIDDAHWMDEASGELAMTVGRALALSRVMLILIQRPPLDRQDKLLPGLDELSHSRFLIVDQLQPDGVAALVRGTLQGDVSPLVLALIEHKAQGNPFFITELLDILRETEQIQQAADGSWQLSPDLIESLHRANVVHKAKGAWTPIDGTRLATTDLGLPDSVQGIVLARMDRLPPEQALTLRVASVIGRSFDFQLLRSVHPNQPSETALLSQLEIMNERDFIRLETPGAPIAFVFRHNITQEVAYESLLYAQRRRLHRTVAQWYEAVHDADVLSELDLDSTLAPFYPVMVLHWHRAEEWNRERVYAGLAGRQAARQFANSEAIGYLSRALELTEATDHTARYQLLWEREAVYEWQGDRGRQARDAATVSELAEQLQDDGRRAQAMLRRANLARLTGDLDTALALLGQAATYARRAGDAETEVQILEMGGQVLWRQNNYEGAREKLQQAQALAERAGGEQLLAQVIYDLGLNDYYQERFADAQERFRRAQQLYSQASDRRGEINCLLMFGTLSYRSGQYQVGQNSLEQALDLCQTVGWRHGESFVLSTLGNYYFDLGDHEEAQKYQRQALAVCREVGDLEGEAISLDTLGLILDLLGDPQSALTHYQQAMAIQEKLGDRRGLGYTLTHRGYALLHMGDLSSAQATMTQALNLRRTIGEDGASMDNLAALAHIAQVRGNLQQAALYVKEAMGWIQVNGATGIEFPVQACLTTYEVSLACTSLDDQAQALAQQALRTGYGLVQERARAIENDDLRQMYLNNVPANRAIIAAWERQNKQEH